MSGQQIGTVVGGIIGAYFGGPAGAQLGMAIGGAIGGAVDPEHIYGPKIGDGQRQTATDGIPIAWVQGTATVAGTIVQVGPRRQIRKKEGGKGGGPVQVTFEAHQEFAILICESSELRDSTIDAVVMVEQDGKIVYDVRPGSKLRAQSTKWKRNVRFLFGDENQMPDPTLEGITGVGNTPAYRGSCIAVFTDFNVTAVGDRIPNFRFTVASSATTTIVDNTLASDSHTTAGTYVGGDQTHVVGWYQDFPVDPRVGDQLRVISVNHWALNRTYIVPLFDSEVVPQVVPLSTVDVVPFTQQSGTFDTGWRYYYNPDVDPPPQGFWDWFDGHGFSRPVVDGDAVAPATVYFPRRATGVRVVSMSYFGAFDMSPQNVVFQTANPAALQLTPFGGGYYVDAVLSLWRPLWRSAYGDVRVDVGSVLLSDIVANVMKRGGLVAQDYDVADFATTQVLGYPIARQASAADCISPLLAAYFAYASEYDERLHFKFYGADAAVTIDRADLVEGNDANSGAINSDLRNQATEFPRRVVGSYMDPGQNYTVVTVASERRSIEVVAIGERNFEIPVVMTAETAVRAVDKALKVAYATLEGTQEYSVPYAGAATYLKLCSGEPLIFLGKRYTTDELILSDGYLKLTTRYDRQSAYTSRVQAIAGNAPAAPSTSTSGLTQLVAMNLPSLRPQDTYGVYLAAGPMDALSTSWIGCTVQVSYDGMETWQSALQMFERSTMGQLALDEPVGGEPLTVAVDGDLESATDAQLAARANACVMITADDVSEIAQFKTATETTTPGTYELTDVARGLLSTGQMTRLTGERFVMLDSVYFLAIPGEFAGRQLFFRAVGFGETAEDTPVLSLVYTPDLTTIHDGGTVTT